MSSFKCYTYFPLKTIYCGIIFLEIYAEVHYIGIKVLYFCGDFQLLRAAWRQMAIGWFTQQHGTEPYISRSSTTTREAL